MARGLNRLAPDAADTKKGAEKPMPKGGVSGEKGEEQTTITHHGDGTHTTQHADGSSEEHPDHLHMLASLGHKITGGDKHHIAHHDGGGAVTEHGINEDGEHYDGEDQDGGEGGDEAGGRGAGDREEPSYGGMRG
jgi:hypothetical protein